MADHPVTYTYDEGLPMVELTDTVHKDTVNPWWAQLVNNDAVEHYFVNAKEYGSIGSGGDDTAVIQAALDDAATTKLKVFVPPGTYLCNVSMGTEQTLFGAGIGRTILKPFTDKEVILVDSTSVAKENAQLHDFSIEGDTSKTSQDGIRFAGTNQNDWHKLWNLEILTCGRDGIRVVGRMIWSSFQNIRIDQCEGCGVYLEGTGAINLNTFINVAARRGKNHGWRVLENGVIPNQLTFINCNSESNVDGTNTVHGFYFTRCQGFMLANCWAEKNGLNPTGDDSTGVFIDGTNPYANSILGGYYTNHNYGIRVEGGSSKDTVLTLDGGVRIFHSGDVTNPQSGLKVESANVNVTYGDVRNSYATEIDDVVDANSNAHVHKRFPVSSAIQTFTNNDTTPTVRYGNVFLTSSGAPTTITMLDDGFKGQEVAVIVNDSNTTIDFTGTNLKGNAGVDWSPANGDHMVCVFDGTDWYCRISDNTA